MIAPSMNSPEIPGHTPAYSLDLVASACGLDSATVLLYHEQGLITAADRDASGAPVFDDDCLHRLRRIEHLRETYALQTTALRLTLDLMDEVERLRAALRQHR